MKQQVQSLTESLEDVTKQAHEVSQQLSHVEARLDGVVRPICVRQMAISADNAAIDAIFPQCRKMSYYVRSFRNLLSFLSKPEYDDFTGPYAPAAWLELKEDGRAAITAKAAQFVRNNPYLKLSIDTLKDAATVQETLQFYMQQGDEEVCDAIKVCAGFLRLTSTVSDTSETEAE